MVSSGTLGDEVRAVEDMLWVFLRVKSFFHDSGSRFDGDFKDQRFVASSRRTRRFGSAGKHD
jgi:hypothetical protein